MTQTAITLNVLMRIMDGSLRELANAPLNKYKLPTKKDDRIVQWKTPTKSDDVSVIFNQVNLVVWNLFVFCLSAVGFQVVAGIFGLGFLR